MPINAVREMSSESEWELNNSDKSDESDESHQIPKRRTSSRIKATANYSSEHHDTFFEGVKGYTSFDRTRKGGDRRPRAATKKKIPVCLH